MNEPVFRWLRTPTGWLVFQLIEYGVLFILVSGLATLFPGLSRTVGWVLLLGIFVIMVRLNYWLRRRFLS